MPCVQFDKISKTRLCILLSLLLIEACSDATPLLNNDHDWPLYGRDYTNQRYSPLDQINRHNVQKLTLAWKYSTGKKATFQTSPIVVDNTMFITTPFNDVIALDAASGREIWRYRHSLSHKDYCCGPANRGPAVADGRVFTVTIDSRLIALDQATGEVLWDKKITDSAAEQGEILEPLLGLEELAGAVQTGQTGYTANLAPQVYNGMVFAGITGTGYGLHVELQEDGEPVLSVGGLSGGGHGLRGFLVAYDARTGNEIWRWYSVPETGWEGGFSQSTIAGDPLDRDIAQEKRGFEKFSDSWRYGGGSIWTTPAIDPELGLIYLGTGNPSPQMDASTRPGDNLYTVSLVALDIDTGELRWYYQQVPHDRWGYDVASPPILFDYTVNGTVVPAVGQASKLGWFFIHDRRTGDLLQRSEPFIEQTNLFTRPTAEGVRIVPGALGASSWSPVAYHPRQHTVYISGIYQPSLFYSRQLTPEPGKPWESVTFFRASPEPDWGIFSAISLTTGRVLWQHRVEDPMVGGALATAGGLVFSGEGNGNFNAHDAETGQLLWQHHSQYGVNAPPVSYSIGGVQYIAVAAGGNKLFGYETGDEVLVFSLQSTP
ncbi:MAG: PQQ-binding-like beta-propeller repeat protein [Thiotrichales bacterium]|nr:PQQ-binding-like beta-propeller repeat protein [Thiotrichales bacterium]